MWHSILLEFGNGYIPHDSSKYASSFFLLDTTEFKKWLSDNEIVPNHHVRWSLVWGLMIKELYELGVLCVDGESEEQIMEFFWSVLSWFWRGVSEVSE